MNIFRLEEQILFHLDLARMPRFTRDKIAGAVVSAQDAIINEFLDGIQGDNALEQNVKSMTRFMPLMKTTLPIPSSGPVLGTNLVIQGNRIPYSSLPPDFGYPVHLWVTINGTEYRCDWLRQNQLDINLDPFAKPNIMGIEKKVYAEFTANGFEVSFGDYGTITDARLRYIMQPTLVSFGYNVQYYGVTPSEYPTLLRQTEYYFDDATALMDLNPIAGALPGMPTLTTRAFPKGFTYTTEEDETPKMMRGSAYTGYVNPAFPDIMFDELAQRTANILRQSIARMAAPEK